MVGLEYLEVQRDGGELAELQMYMRGRSTRQRYNNNCDSNCNTTATTAEEARSVLQPRVSGERFDEAALEPVL